MDEADTIESRPGNPAETSSEAKGHMDSERPRPEGEDTTTADKSPSQGRHKALRTAAEVQESEQLYNERDRVVRKGSAGSHRSRHSSEGSSSSRKGNRSRHKSKRDGGAGDEKPRSRSASRTRSSDSASSHHSRTKSHKNRATMNANRENASASEDGDDAAYSVVHVDSFTLKNGDERPASSCIEETGKESKKIAKMGKKLMTEKMKYMTEKQLLKAKMEKARKQFEEEVTKYERELDGKTQEMQTKFSDLRVDEQYTSLSQRMNELAGFRDELDSRFLQCLEYEKEIEEIERYLDRRQELCNSKKEDLRLIHDQLDTLHQELELDKERLERAGFDATNMAPRNRTSSFRTSQKGTQRDEDDYILKANLRKCQSDFKKADQTVHERDVEIAQAKEEISSLRSEKTKHREKIKQLETQLSVALSQLMNQTNATHSSSGVTVNRHASVRSHVSLDRFKSPADLSINQQAQLNRSLSGKEKGGVSSSGKKYLSSGSSSANLPSARPRTRSDGERSRGSSSDGVAGEGDATQDFQMRPRSLTEDDAQPRTVSSTCAVM